MTSPCRTRKRRRANSSTAVRLEHGQCPKELDLENVPVYSKDKELVPRLVRVFQTYAASLSQREQNEFINMMQSGEYLRYKGGSPPVRAAKHHFYMQMYDTSSAFWLREEITFVKWALLATLYPPETLSELAKVIVELGLERRPRFNVYARAHKTKLESLDLPNALQLAKQCTVNVRITSLLDLGRSNSTQILRESMPGLGSVVPEHSEEQQTEDVSGAPNDTHAPCRAQDASTNTIQLTGTPSVDTDPPLPSFTDNGTSRREEEHFRQIFSDQASRLARLEGILSEYQERVDFLEVTSSDNRRAFDDLHKIQEAVTVLQQQQQAVTNNDILPKLEAIVPRIEIERDADRKEVATFRQRVTKLEEMGKVRGTTLKRHEKNIGKNTDAIKSHRSNTTTSVRKLYQDQQKDALEMASHFEKMAASVRARYDTREAHEGGESIGDGVASVLT